MTLDVEKIRSEFPILSTEMRGQPLTYLDSGASAQKPRVVIDAMADAFERSAGETLDERLLQSLEAGRDAGGQGDALEGHRTERSAGLHIYKGEAYAEMDLRVDVHDTAIEELRRIHTVYKPYIPYYELRHSDPQNTPAQHQWVREMEARIRDGR